jgi:hypothetical protein
MRSSRGLGLLCLALLFAAAPSRANVVVNGSFESPGLSFRSFCITFFTPACPAIPAWTGNFYLVNDDSGGGIGGVPAAPIPDGGQYIMIQMTGGATQSVTIGQAGTYTLSWFDAGRTFFSNIQNYEVVFGGNVLGFFSTATTSPWLPHILPLTTGAGTFDLTFQGLNSAGGDNSVFLDDVVLNAPAAVGAPEPGTVGLAVGALLAMVGRRLRWSC